MKLTGIQAVFLSAVLLTASVAFADNNSTAHFTTRIKVAVTADDKLSPAISSYINRELRSLKDVEIVDVNPEWELSVIAMEVTNVGGDKVGVAISTKISRYVDNRLILKPGLSFPSNLTLFSDHLLNVGATRQIEELCKQIIVNFDTTHLEVQRKSFRELIESRKKSDMGNKQKE